MVQPAKMRIGVDHKRGDLSDKATFSRPPLRKGDAASLLRNEKVKRTLLPSMLDKARELGTARSLGVIEEAMKRMRSEMSAEITRLRDLAEINDHIKPEEISTLALHESELSDIIAGARVRLDAIRLIWKGPPN